jgi:ATP-dependent exoDNAse (exonuclease V) beta subunit
MRKLDKNQKLAVKCDQNVVVSAGAGAGKTTVLSERYFRLISEGKAGVENILTLTFTRKAAAEMNERIYQRLLNSKDPVVIKQAAEFDKAKISTLDSFSAQVVRNGSEFFGVPTDFVLDNDASATMASETALDFILKKQTDKFLQEFIYLHGFQSVYEELFVSLAINEFNLSDPINFKELLKNQKAEFNKIYLENLEKLEKIRTDILSLDSKIGKAMLDNFAVFEKFWNLEKFSSNMGSSLFLQIIDEIKLTKGRGGHSEKPLLNEFIENWRTVLTITGSLANGILSLPFLEGMFDLLGDYQSIFLTKKRTSGILTFQDVSRMAVSILKSNIDLRNFYKKEFRYIMIDEFQDNNLMQKELLYLLAEKKGLEGPDIPKVEDLEPDKLFFVGDEKQSIYSFRGADVSVFKGLSDELIKSGGESLSLSTNYRSEPDLIIFFNRIFDIVMENSGEPYEANFEALDHRDSIGDLIPEISVFYKPESDAEEDYLTSNEAEAWYIANYIKEKVENKSLIIAKDGELQNAGYDDFAILMRSTSNQIMYEKYFRKLNVPCTVQGVRALFMEAPVNDIYNILQLLVYPEDRVSFSALLRSPFVNLSDDIIGAILLDGKIAFAISDLNEIAAFDVGPDEIIKYKNIRELFYLLSDKVDLFPIADLIRIIWYEGGYRNYLLSNDDYHGYLEYYDYLKILALRSNEKGECLAVFLDFIRENLGKYEKLPDLELLRDEIKGVQLLTIHKSKGLEFPVVIVANTGNKGRIGGNSPYYISDEFGITLKYESKSGGKANYFYDRAKDFEAKKELAENKRILYVALTRAQSHLIISGGHNRNTKNSETSTGTRVLLNMVLKGLGWDGDIANITTEQLKKYISIIPDVSERDVYLSGGRSRQFNFEKTKADYNKSEIIIRNAVRDTWSVSEINSTLINELNSCKRISETLSPFECDKFLKEGQYAAFGTYCHNLIEQKLKNSGEDIHLSSKFQGFTEEQKKTVKQNAEELSLNFLNSSFARKYKDSILETELPFIFNAGDKKNPIYINGQIDLLIEKKDGITIIDFKTDKYKDPAEYSIQMFLYRKAAVEVFDKPVRTYLFYLREGLETEVSDEYSFEDVLRLLK